MSVHGNLSVRSTGDWFRVPFASTFLISLFLNAAVTLSQDLSAASAVAKPLQFVEKPAFLLNANPSAPLCGEIRFEANKSVFAELTIDDGVGIRSLRIPQEAAVHRFPLIGFRAGRDHVVQVRISDRPFGTADAEQLTESTRFSAPGKPADLPEFRVHHSNAEQMEPGVTLFNLIRWKSFLPDDHYGMLVAVDETGHVVWYWKTDKMLFFSRSLPTGNFLCLYGDQAEGIVEVTPAGEVVRHLAASGRNRPIPQDAIQVPVAAIHHDVYPLTDGHLLTLSPEVRFFEDYPHRSYHSRRREPAHVVGDVLVEIGREGAIVNEWKLLDLLDPQRIGYGSLHDFWDQRGFGNLAGGTRDWSHANAITYDAQRDAMILSVRHQDALICVERKSGALKWILGNRDGWRPGHLEKLLKPRGPIKWPYHQHAVSITPQGTLLCFDNGNYQATPYERQTPAARNHSRVVEYSVDPEEMTVSQVWEYSSRPGDRFYSTYLSGAQWLPETGNVLIADGGILRDIRGNFTDVVPGVTQSAQIMEITYETPAKRLFQLEVPAQPLRLEGWSIYRAERVKHIFERKVDPKN